MTSPTNPGSLSPRVLIVGAAPAVVHLFQWLQHSDVSVTVAGCLIPRSTPAESAASVARVLQLAGNLDAVKSVIEDRQIDRVLISMPLTDQPTIHRLTAQLDDLAMPWSFVPTPTDHLAGVCNGMLSQSQVFHVEQLDEPGSESESTDLNEVNAKPASPIIATLPGAAKSSARQQGDRGAKQNTQSEQANDLKASVNGVDPIALLNRQMAPLDEAAIRRTITGKTVMITGAGGSIGSELARIVARFKPSRLVLVERAENSLFDIDRGIARLFPKQERAAVLHDVTDAPRTRAVVVAQKPNVIFHAAAHKHVPMMEDHPSAAVENNYYGTRSIADAAAAQGVDRFVMISTDKAVNPTSVMGATKRLAELYIQYLNARSDTTFSMVRFGNVLGSACSVLPIWSKQLADGDPITVTHPDMMRFFMTIPEAAGLVLQSGSLSTGGEVFLLDMGDPIRIVDMARRFIAHRGLTLDVDASIVFTGIRPGEKLYEELAYDSEDMLPTPHDAIRIWRTTPPDVSRMRQIMQMFDRLRGQANDDAHRWQRASDEAILSALRKAVPEMRVSDEMRLKQTA